jgi:hypothetical protein
MSNKKWVCCGCRVAVRRSQGDDATVLCSECGKPCSNIGYKIPVPPKSKVREWERLREQLNQQKNETTLAKTQTLVRRKHELEREIVRLEAMPRNEGRTKAVKLLRKKLEALNA